MRVKKLSQEYRIRLVLWNIGSLTGRLAELVYAMVRRNVSTLCMQEIKWVGEKARSIGVIKLWYTGKDRNCNRMDVIIDKQLLEDVVEAEMRMLR